MDGFLLMEIMAEQRAQDLQRRSRSQRQREEALAGTAARPAGLRSRLAGVLLALALRLDRAGTATRLTMRPL